MDTAKMLILAGFLLVPAVSPLVNVRSVGWRAALAAAVLKVAIASAVAAVLLSGFPRWFAEKAGEFLYLASALGGLLGALMFVIAGFGRSRDVTAYNAVFRVVAWSSIGAVVFVISIAVFTHPLDIGKAIISFRSAHSLD